MAPCLEIMGAQWKTTVASRTKSTTFSFLRISTCTTTQSAWCKAAPRTSATRIQLANSCNSRWARKAIQPSASKMMRMLPLQAMVTGSERRTRCFPRAVSLSRCSQQGILARLYLEKTKRGSRSSRPWSSAWSLIKKRRARFNCRTSPEFLKCLACMSTTSILCNTWMNERTSLTTPNSRSCS